MLGWGKGHLVGGLAPSSGQPPRVRCSVSTLLQQLLSPQLSPILPAIPQSSGSEKWGPQLGSKAQALKGFL